MAEDQRAPPPTSAVLMSISKHIAYTCAKVLYTHDNCYSSHLLQRVHRRLGLPSQATLEPDCTSVYAGESVIRGLQEEGQRPQDLLEGRRGCDWLHS